jgi:excinuclease ABC subunit A
MVRFASNDPLNGIHRHMPSSDIVIKGAREHNLRDIELVLPRNHLICLTGVSGSGKSSLAFDTLFAEGQRRYVESLSSFARQFIGQMPKPDVDMISGLSPSISISQKSSGNNPRSTVGTITEIYDFLRVLFARAAQGYCPKCNQPIAAQTRDQIIASLMQYPQGAKYMVMAPVIRGQKGEHRDLFVDLLKQGFSRARVDGEVRSLSGEIRLDRGKRHDIEVIIDRLTHSNSIRSRLTEAVELALKYGKGTMIVLDLEGGPDESRNSGPAVGLVSQIESGDKLPIGSHPARGDRRRGAAGQGAFIPPIMLVGIAISALPPPRRRCSALTVRAGCASIAGGWENCTRLTRICWSLTRPSPFNKDALN